MNILDFKKGVYMNLLEMITCFIFLIVANIFIVLKVIKKNAIYLILNLLVICCYIVYISQFWHESKTSIGFIILNICALYYMSSYYFTKSIESSTSKKVKYVDSIVLVLFIFLLIDNYY